MPMTVRHILAQEKYKKIIKALANISHETLNTLAFDELRKIDLEGIVPDSGYLPWELLLLIKWSYRYGGEPTKARATKNELNELLNKIKYIHNAYILNKKYSLRQLLRRIAFQQLPFQYTKIDLGLALFRQLIIFLQLPESTPLANRFQARTQLAPKQFIYLTYATWVILGISNQRVLNIASYRGIFPEDDIRSYLRVISLPNPEIRTYIERDVSGRKKPKTLEIEVHEDSLFLLKPLIQIDDNYLPLSVRVFEMHAMHFIYNYLKTDQTISGQFGLTNMRCVM